MIISKLRLSLLLFWRDIIYKLGKDTIFKLQLKLIFSLTTEYIDQNTKFNINSTNELKNINIQLGIGRFDQVRSIGDVKLYSKKDYYKAFEYMQTSLIMTVDNYHEFFIKNIILTFSICKDDSILKKEVISNNSLNLLFDSHLKNKIVNKSKLKINSKKLPITTDLFQWGNLQRISGNYPYNFDNLETRLIISNSESLESSFNYMVTIRGIELKDKKIIVHQINLTDKSYKNVILSFIDIIYDPKTPSSFVRIIKNNQYIYDKGVLVYSQKRKSVKYFRTLSKCKCLTKNFITMDLETKSINGTLIPYCVSIFDGKKAYSFYIDEFISSDEMLKASIRFILKRKYNKHRVYLQNFSYFDGIFLMKIISDLVDAEKMTPVIRDNRIINLRVEYESEKFKKDINKKDSKIKYYVEFRDSYLLLTSSLEKLGKTFAINEGKLEQKLPFPYKFVNEPNIKYNYVGPVPEFKYYDKINENEYTQLIISMKNEGKDLSK